MTVSADKEKVAKNQEDTERGQRLKRLRALAGLDLNELAELIDVNRVTVSYWQSGSPPGLSIKGAHKVINILKEKKGIECNFEWLWDGTGKPPHIQEPALTEPKPQADEMVSSIQNEINLFTRTNKDTVIIKINDEQLYPFFNYHDIVAGAWQPLQTLNGEGFCIIKLNNINQVRWVKKAEKGGRAVLSYSPSSSETEEIATEKVAPVIRVWR